MEDKSIVFLKGADRIRKRPQVIFGEIGHEGVLFAVRSVLDIFIIEASFGFCDQIEVTLHKDHSLTVKSHDSGFALDETPVDGTPAWKRIFCDLFCGPREPDLNYYESLGMIHHELYGRGKEYAHTYKTAADHNFDLCCLQYASEWMQVEAVKGGIKKTARFEKGSGVSDLQKEPTAEKNGTKLCFRPDPEVFEAIDIPANDLEACLRDAAICLPNLTCVVRDERADTTATYHYPGGALDYVTEKAAPVAIFTNQIKATGKDRYNKTEYTAEVKVLIGFTDRQSEVLCLHTFKNMSHGGSHLRALQENVAKHVEWQLGRDILREKYGENAGFDFEMPTDRMILILESTCPTYITGYENGTRKSIDNRMITDMCSDLIDGDFGHFLSKNRDAILKTILAQ